MMPDSLPAVATEGTLLGGRVGYRQLRDGYRTGIEPVLLAASMTAKPGDRVVEGGTGAGAALLCLAARVPGVHVVGVEQDGRVAALARENIAANGFPLATVDTCDVLDLAPGPRFDHAMANPPWHDPAGPASPSPGRDAAKRARPGLLPAWCAALARAVCPGGSLTVLVPAALIDQALGALAQAGCGDPHLLPLWPRAGQDAKLLLLRGVRGGRGPARILPGLVLHEGQGFSAAAHAILWEGAALPWR